MKIDKWHPFIILFIVIIVGLASGSFAFAQKYSKNIHWQDRRIGKITTYPKGHQATAPYLPENIVNYNKQHLPFTDHRDMYLRGQKSHVLYTPELIVNYDKQHLPIVSE